VDGRWGGRLVAALLVAAVTVGLLGTPSTSGGAVASASTQPVPGPPTDAYASATIGRVELQWNWPSPLPWDGAITDWVVARRVPGGVWTDLATVPAERFVDTGVTPGRTYEYRIRATGPDGDGVLTSPLAVPVPRVDLVGSEHGRLAALPSVGPSLAHGLGSGSEGRPAVSPDGRWTVVARVVDTQTTHLWRMPTHGPGAAVQLTSLPGRVLDPAWSPDGTRVAFTRERSGSAPSVWEVPSSGGEARLLADRAAEAAWDRDGTLIVTDRSSSGPRLQRVAADGTRRTVPGTAGGRHAAVSPDGRLLAFTVAGSSTGPNGAPEGDRALAVVPLHASTSSPVVTALQDGGYHLPTWHPDGRSVVVRYGQRTWSGTRAFDHGGLASLRLASTPARLEATGPTTVSSVGAPAYRSLGVHLTSAPQLTGAAPRIGFAVADVPAGTTFTCRLDAAPAEACTSPWRGSGLASGVRHLVVEAREPSGQRTVTSHRWRVDATPPVVKLTGPGPLTLTDRATITYGASDADGVTSYDVRYRRARFDGGFAAWVRPETWQATTATSRSVAVTRGYEYCFAVRARDGLGNVSAWSSTRCTGRPLDDAALRASAGWTRGTGTQHLDGTISSTTRNGATLTRANVQAKQVTLLATRCASCGTVEVFIGSTRIGRVDLTASTTRRQQVIALPVAPSVRSGTLTIRVTSSGKRVEIDAVAFRRS
jgi:hypothetical protein